MNLFTESVSKCVDNLRTSRFFEARLGFTHDACKLGSADLSSRIDWVPLAEWDRA